MNGTQQTEALRLADKYEVEGFLQDHRFAKDHWCRQAAAELRRQHARIEELEAQLSAIGAGGVEPLRKQDQPAAAPQAVPASVITGAIYDFAGYLTTLPHEKALHCSEAHKASPMVEAITEWCKRRGLHTDGARVENWREAIATQQGLDSLTSAARDVLVERQRQIEAEGWKTERDDVYDTGEIALAAACYAAHSASCAAIKAPHTAPGVFVRTRSAQDFVGEMWPWSEDWWKPSGHRRNLEKAGALILAEIERIDRATLAAQAKKGGAT